VNERGMMVVGAILGAAAGAAVGFLLFTERGRQLREDLEPELDTIFREAGRLKAAFEQVRDGVSALRSDTAEAWPRRSA
jgi:gas vesicle protein